MSCVEKKTIHIGQKLDGNWLKKLQTMGHIRLNSVKLGKTKQKDENLNVHRHI